MELGLFKFNQWSQRLALLGISSNTFLSGDCIIISNTEDELLTREFCLKQVFIRNVYQKLQEFDLNYLAEMTHIQLTPH